MLDKDGLTQEVSVGVTYASLMSAVSLFFTGAVIAQYSDFDASIKVPLVFLIISTFSFIFAATIYTNASTELTLNKFHNVKRYMIYAKNIDELLGLYLFILATPMVLGAVTQDSFLRIVTIIVVLGGFTLYSQSRFSILDDELTRPMKRVVSFLIVALALHLYFYQNSGTSYALELYSMVAILVLGVLGSLTYIFCTGGKQYNPTTFRNYEDDDADEISALILKNLQRIRSRKVPKEVLKALKVSATPTNIKKLAGERSMTVAEFKGKVAGVASLYGNEITDVFTDPGLHRKGIGRRLVEYLEEKAKEDGFKFTTVTATAVDRNFYLKVGYELESETHNKTVGTAYHMKKKLR